MGSAALRPGRRGAPEAPPAASAVPQPPTRRRAAGWALAAGLALHLQAPSASSGPAHGLAASAEKELHNAAKLGSCGDHGAAADEAKARKVRLRRGKERRLRDAHVDMPASVNRQLDQAAMYFSNSVRVPAALIAGQAGNMLHRLTELGAAQRPPGSPAAERPSLRTRIYVALWRTHFLLTGYTVCAQLTAVLLCSTAHAQILDIGRDELAVEPTALDLIIRHVEFEYVMVRIAFFSGLVTFLLAIATRAVASLGAGPRQSTASGRREVLLCAALGAMLVSTLAWWVHVYSEEMTNQGSFYLVRRFTKLFIVRLRGNPLAILAAAAGSFSIILAAASLLQPQPMRPLWTAAPSRQQSLDAC